MCHAKIKYVRRQERMTMKPIVKKILPFVGVVALTALGTLGIMKKDTLLYKLYQKSYKHQIKKENITPYH